MIVLRKKLYASLFAVTLLSGCSLFGDDDVVKMSPLPKVENQFKPNKVWSTSVGDGVGKYYSHLQPAFANDVVYAADRDGMVKAMNAENGKQLWRVNLADGNGFFSSSTPAILSGGVTVDGDVLYVGSERAQLYALNTSDGSLIWRSTVAGEVLSKPVVTDISVLINTGNGMLQSVDRASGTVNWTINLEVPALSLRGESSPALAHGAAIVGSSSGRVSAVLLDQGQLIWQQRIAQPGGATEISRLSDVDVTPVVADDIAYAVAYNGNLAAIDLRTGQVIWKRDFGSITNFAIEGNMIYFVDQDDRVMALDRNGGSIVWTQNELLHRNLTSPVVYQGNLVVGDSEGYLHWLDINDGHFVAQNKVSGSGLLSGPQIVNGNLMIQARNGTVYTFNH
jgi:outer membrane protein assembly factor BamB